MQVCFAQRGGILRGLGTIRSVGLALVGLALVGAPQSALGFEFATDTGEPDGNRLRWQPGQPIHFTQHVEPGGGFPAFLLHAEARRAFQTWAAVEESGLEFIEDDVFAGSECPHSLPDGASSEETCGGALPPHDFRSALFFIETVWPFGEEVIALTTLSWREGGELVDADISFNGVDYDWSVSTDENKVDYQSIVLHEVGHFIGLGHSADPEAVMRADYDEGDIVRSLGADDRAGIAALYPCNNVPCAGGVAVESAACSSVGSSALPLLAVLAISLCSLLLLRSERRRRSGATLVLVLLFMLPASLESSTVLGLDIEALAERADRVVRARVISQEAFREGIVWTRTELEVGEDWKGNGASRVELTQPGGVADGLGTKTFGVPSFEVGEEVVLFLRDNGIVGLSQGAFKVRAGARVERDLSGLSLARVGGHRAPLHWTAPENLTELRSVVVDDL